MTDETFELALLDWGQVVELVVVSQGMVVELSRVIETERVYQVKGIVRAVASPVIGEGIGVGETAGISVRVRSRELPVCEAGEVMVVRWMGERYRMAGTRVGEAFVVLEAWKN